VFAGVRSLIYGKKVVLGIGWNLRIALSEPRVGTLE
jgi:hypothetical protein